MINGIRILCIIVHCHNKLPYHKVNEQRYETTNLDDSSKYKSTTVSRWFEILQQMTTWRLLNTTVVSA